MLLTATKIFLAAVAVYFLALGVISLFRPSQAKRFLLGFADSALKHYAELFIRLFAGSALLVFAPTSSYSTALSIAGWLLLGTTAAMAILPWRVHNRFAQKYVPKALKYLPIVGVTSLGLGGLLLWSIFTANPA
jgi:hypothetical protein